MVKLNLICKGGIFLILILLYLEEQSVKGCNYNADANDKASASMGVFFSGF